MTWVLLRLHGIMEKVTQNISWQRMIRIFLEKKKVWVSHGIDFVETVMFMSTNKIKSSWTGGVVGDLEHNLD